MSSLGDLLLLHSKQAKAKVEKVSDSENNCDDNTKQSQQFHLKTSPTNQEKSLSSSSKSQTSPSQFVNFNTNDNDADSREARYSEADYSNRQAQRKPPSNNPNMIFSKYIEKNDIEETQSNASSTDDLVRELLDPNDRPKNVWHVVEAPAKTELIDDDIKQKSSDTHDSRDKEYGNSPNYEVKQKLENPSTIPPPPPLHSPPPPPSPPNDKLQVDKKDSRHSNDRQSERKSDRRRDRRSRDRRDDDRERSSSSHRARNTETVDRDRDRRRDRNRDRNSDRNRHGRRGSPHKRRDCSDDDDYDRHRSSHRRRRSNSRGSRGSPSRRIQRSRSNSPTLTSKRDSRTILVMQLSPRVETRDLEDFFSDIGKVREVRLIMDTKTRRHKGIAYIEFESSHSATKAFSLNGKKLFGASLLIQAVQSDRNRPTSHERHRSSSRHSTNHDAKTSHSSSHLPPNCYRVYVGGLNVNLTEDMIRSVFEPFGPIIRLELMRDRVTNVSRGYAFITYADIEDGQNAVQCLDGFELAGKSLRVSKSADKSERFATQNSSAEGANSSGASRHEHTTSGSGAVDHFNDINDPYSNFQNKFR